jgi:hypothetical protein
VRQPPSIPLQLNNYHIKLLAAFWMVVDHIGAIFLPEVNTFRVLGRLSFPLFAWLLAQGEQHTRNFQRYLLRLVILGVVSQPVYLLTLPTQNLNILFTLALGLFILRLIKPLPPLIQYTMLTGAAIAAEILEFSYGIYGIFLIWLISQFQPTLRWWLLWISFHIGVLILFKSFGLFQLPAVVTPAFLHLANDQKGASARWFYTFYPLHLLILLAIKNLT